MKDRGNTEKELKKMTVQRVDGDSATGFPISRGCPRGSGMERPVPGVCSVEEAQESQAIFTSSWSTS